MTTTLFGWGPMFGIPGPSPFVMKTEMQLQMLGVSFDRAIANLDAVSKKKAPYVDDGGMIIQDSYFIRTHFERKLGVDLDEGLSLAQRGTAWALERMLENHLGLVITCERWLEGDNFNRGPRQFFMGVPEQVRAQVCEDVCKSMREWTYGQGIGRHTRAERLQQAERDITAVAQLLGDKPYLFGPGPVAADAVAFAFLTAANSPIFESELPKFIQQNENLGPYLKRIENQYFKDNHWPSAA